MNIQDNPSTAVCPGSAALVAQAHQTLDKALRFCQRFDGSFWDFEKRLFVMVAVLGRLLVQLFLAARHERLKLGPFLEDGVYRVGDRHATRTLKTAHGEVAYARTQLVKKRGGAGFFPLDAVLGLTRDRLSPLVMQLVARLATRLSFAASQLVCKALLRWAPATETIEQVVLGLGRQAAPFMQQLAAPPDDGEV
ncbi:MAG: hypothetical protein L0215_06005 [Gemmataceae bacterium]|nr:hypothetical protein [Gemmataceae bacterium]